MLARVRLKLDQFRSFLRDTRTPVRLVLDALRLQPWAFVAEDRRGVRIRLLPRRGEGFTFYENVLRRDYLSGGVAPRPGSTVVDIGANIGTFAVTAAAAVGPTGRVVAFEPDPAVHARLAANLALNGLGNVEAINAAVSGRSGRLELIVSSKSAYSSLHAGVDGRDGSGSRRVSVEVRAINEVLDALGPGPIDLMKVDCEGAEYDIFDALTPRLARRIRRIAMETHVVPGRDVGDLGLRLRALGFRVAPGHPLIATREDAAESPPVPVPVPVGV